MSQSGSFGGSPSLSSAPIQVGDVVADKYRVERVLGQGAMGIVVAARHLDLQELRAIKFMLPAIGMGTEGVERFLREARAASQIKSPHIVQVLDVGRLSNGLPYLVMEYLEGTDIKSVLDARGALPVGEAISYIVQACRALVEAHAAGIIHRDIKPANLFLAKTPNGDSCVKVLDFGVAKVRGATDGEATGTDWVMGTPSYMAPEQMRSARDVDPRADVWSIGAVLYRMLSARLPYPGGPMEVAGALSVGAPPPPIGRADVPPEVEAVVLACMAHDLTRRYQTVGAVAAALLPFSAGRPVPFVDVPAPSPSAPGPSTASRASWGSSVGPSQASSMMASPPPSRWPLFVGGAAVGVLLLGGAGFIARDRLAGSVARAPDGAVVASPPVTAVAPAPPSASAPAAPVVVPSAAPVASSASPSIATAPPPKLGPKLPPADAFGDSRR